MTRQWYEENPGDLFQLKIIPLFVYENQVLITEGVSQGQNELPVVFELSE